MNETKYIGSGVIYGQMFISKVFIKLHQSEYVSVIAFLNKTYSIITLSMKI